MLFSILLISFVLNNFVFTVESVSQPNIILIVADDLGWNDVSFHGSNEIITPNIDALAYNGIILNNMYAMPVCTPSRVALLTGKHPIHLGMQGDPIESAEPFGLPLREKILPQYLKELNYTTRAVGKWHLGFFSDRYTPLSRGFDSFYGYYGGYIGYYDHMSQAMYSKSELFTGYDFRKDRQTDWDAQDLYATDLFTEEAADIIDNHDTSKPLFLYFAHLAVHAGNDGRLLEAPQSVISKFSYIIEPNRRTYAAMVSKLDDSIGEIVQALRRKNMLKDSIIVFMSDNGAPGISGRKIPNMRFSNWGSNDPFRGTKSTLWEGGVKVPTIIWSSSLLSNRGVSNRLMHISDWLPTLYTAAGGDLKMLPSDIYGVSHWNALITHAQVEYRTAVLINIDEVRNNSAVRIGNWKLLTGSRDVSSCSNVFTSNKNSANEVKESQRYLTSVVNSTVWNEISNLYRHWYVHGANEFDVTDMRSKATIKCDANTPVVCNRNEIDCQQAPCLFNINEDPCETTNLINIYQDVSRKLYRMLSYYRSTLVPQPRRYSDIKANPAFHNYTWSPWIE